MKTVRPRPNMDTLFPSEDTAKRQRINVPALPFCRWRITCWKPGYPGDPKTVGDHLKKRRLDLGLDQREVARKLGVNTWSLLNWENAKTSPAVRYYPAIIRFLGYNPFPAPGVSFPERLKAARTARGLSWKGLAKELGVYESTVRDWENGTHKPTRSLYRRVSHFLGL